MRARYSGVCAAPPCQSASLRASVQDGRPSRAFKDRRGTFPPVPRLSRRVWEPWQDGAVRGGGACRRMIPVSLKTGANLAPQQGEHRQEVAGGDLEMDNGVKKSPIYSASLLCRPKVLIRTGGLAPWWGGSRSAGNGEGTPKHLNPDPAGPSTAHPQGPGGLWEISREAVNPGEEEQASRSVLAEYAADRDIPRLSDQYEADGPKLSGRQDDEQPA